MSCIGCNTAITIQKANDEKMVTKAIELAKANNQSVALYRNEEGTLCIATGPGYPIQRIITPQYQNG